MTSYPPIDVDSRSAYDLAGGGLDLCHLGQDQLLDLVVGLEGGIEQNRIPAPRRKHAVVVERNIEPAIRPSGTITITTRVSKGGG